MQRRGNTAGLFAVLLGATASLGACSEYLERTEPFSMTGGNAIASNRVTQMVDPWSRDSADKNIAFNGQRMQAAVERYRNNRVIAPRSMGTSGTYAPQTPGPDPAAGGGGGPVGPTVTQSAAPTK